MNIASILRAAKISRSSLSRWSNTSSAKAQPHPRTMSRPAKRAEAYRSEPDINYRGKTEVVLPNAEKIGVNVVALQPQCQPVNQPIIESPADCSCEGVIGSFLIVDVRSPEQCMRERRKSAYGNRDSWSEEVSVPPYTLANWQAPGDGASNGTENVVGAIPGTKIRYQANPRQEFAFQRTFPTVEAYRLIRTRLRIRIANKYVSAGRNLGMCHACCQEHAQKDACCL